MKKQKGITLIALIITIIVMLILVVITVNFALGDEGILTNAKTAATKTEEKAILEELISMAEFDDGKINVGELKTAATGKYENVELHNGKLTITGKTGTYFYKVTETEISIWKETSDSPEEDNEEIGTIITNEELLSRLRITEYEYTGTYNGNWELIKKENGTKTFVTTGDVGQCTLGVDGDLDTSIQDYIDAVSKIESVVTTATAGINNARSVTIEDIEEILGIGDTERVANNANYGNQYEYYYDNGKIYSIYKARGEENDGAPYNTGKTSFRIVKDGEDLTLNATNPGPVTLTDNYYEYNTKNYPTQQATLEIIEQGVYWLASPCESAQPNIVDFLGRYMYYGKISGSRLFSTNNNAVNTSIGVRAVVSI